MKNELLDNSLVLLNFNPVDRDGITNIKKKYTFKPGNLTIHQGIQQEDTYLNDVFMLKFDIR
jgi:hypothetical protein